MNITVNEQPQRFYLAAKRWEPAVGHEITVGKYRFCAIPTITGVNISEITSGAKVFKIPYSLGIYQSTKDKDGAMELFNKVGEVTKRIVDKQDNFDESINNLKKIAFNRLGEKPEIEDVEVKQ